MNGYLGLIATTLAVAELNWLALRDIIFTVLAVEGFVRWSRKKGEF